MSMRITTRKPAIVTEMTIQSLNSSEKLRAGVKPMLTVTVSLTASRQLTENSRTRIPTQTLIILIQTVITTEFLTLKKAMKTQIRTDLTITAILTATTIRLMTAWNALLHHVLIQMEIQLPTFLTAIQIMTVLPTNRKKTSALTALTKIATTTDSMIWLKQLTEVIRLTIRTEFLKNIFM